MHMQPVREPTMLPKRCRGCGKTKLATCFWLAVKHSPDGRSARCIKCIRKYRAEYYAKRLPIKVCALLHQPLR